MSRFLRWSGVALALMLAAYFVYFAMRILREQDLSALMAPRLFIATAAAAILYALIIPVSGWAWSILLRDLGQSWSARLLAAIMGFTQLAKYVPGNVGQHIGRTALALAKGMPAGSYVSSVFAEALLAMCAGLAVGIACVLLSPLPSSAALVEYRTLLGALAAGLVLAVLALPRLISVLTRLLRSIALTRNWSNEGLASPGIVSAVRAFLAYSLNYLLIGLGLWLVAQAIEAEISTDYFYLTAAFALSWLVGFLTPGAPAGLGVREGAMALLLAGIGTGDAVLVMIAAMRVATLVGDALCFAVSALYLRYAQPERVRGTTA